MRPSPRRTGGTPPPGGPGLSSAWPSAPPGYVAEIFTLRHSVLVPGRPPAEAEFDIEGVGPHIVMAAELAPGA
ncbi:hypothetical protein GCM10010400_14930 [Streptomyces aculeolatus]